MLKQIKIERSALYNIKPLGMDTKNVESLTSYIMRVAYKHNVTVGDLVNKLIIPQMNRDYLLKSSRIGGNYLYEDAKTLNGYMENAYHLSSIMNDLTGREDLRNLTLSRWKGFIPLRNLLKESLSWCPECIADWRNQGSTVYYPLIWHIKIVMVCPKHKRLLVNRCPNCCSKVDLLRRKMISGFCPKCFAPLEQISEKNVSDQELKWQSFVSQNMEDLFSMDVSRPYLRNRVTNRLNSIMDNVFKGNLTHFSNYVKVPKTTMLTWLSGENFPSLEALLKVCFNLNKKIMDLLLENGATGGKIFQINNREVVNQNKNVRNPLDYALVEKKLRYFLAVNEPVSMTTAARQIGRDRRVLYRNFPDLCKQISQRYKDHIKENSYHRIAQLKEEIDVAVNSLINDGIYPSARRIEKITNRNGLLKEKILQDYWKSLLAER